MITNKGQEADVSVSGASLRAGKHLKRFGAGKGTVVVPTVFRARKTARRQATLAAYNAVAIRALVVEQGGQPFLGGFGNSRRQRERELFSSLLDQESPVSELTVAKLIHQRLSVDIVDRIIAEGVGQQEIHALIAPRRTLTHRRSRREPLTVEESDRAVRLARVIALAEAVFADKRKAMDWLRRDAKRFEGQTPMRMLETDAGSRLVEEALIQIDEGYFA